MADEERERIEEQLRRAEAERRAKEAQEERQIERSRDVPDAAKSVLGGRDKRERDEDDD